MTLNDIYLVSQVLAVAALIPSVIYLAVQVRQNTLQARANASYQFLEASANLNMGVLGNKQVAGVIRRGLKSYEALDEDEKFQFLMFVAQHFQTHSTIYEHYRYIVEEQVRYDTERTFPDDFIGVFAGVDFDIQTLCENPATAAAVSAISNYTGERRRAFLPILERYNAFLPLLEAELRARWRLETGPGATP